VYITEYMIIKLTSSGLSASTRTLKFFRENMAPVSPEQISAEAFGLTFHSVCMFLRVMNSGSLASTARANSTCRWNWLMKTKWQTATNF